MNSIAYGYCIIFPHIINSIFNNVAFNSTKDIYDSSIFLPASESFGNSPFPQLARHYNTHPRASHPIAAPQAPVSSPPERTLVRTNPHPLPPKFTHKQSKYSLLSTTAGSAVSFSPQSGSSRISHTSVPSYPSSRTQNLPRTSSSSPLV